MLVFPGKNFCHDFLENFYRHTSAVFGHSSNGWMDTELFKMWIKNVFEPYLTKKCILCPVLLIIDGVKVHINYEISTFCNKNDIFLYILFPNSTHLLQLLDLMTMGFVKTCYCDIAWKWVQENPFKMFDRDAFIEVFFLKVMEKACMIENGKEGFKSSGLYPWDPMRVKEKKMAAAEWYNHSLQVELPRIEQDTEVIQVETVTPINSDTRTPETPNTDGMPVQNNKASKTITLDGITYDLVLSPIAPKDPQRTRGGMQKSPQYTDAVPSTSKDLTTTTSIIRPLQFNSKVDKLLGTPKPKKATEDKKRSGARVSGLS